MSLRKIFLPILLAATVATAEDTPTRPNEIVTAMAYNVENLFDVDAVSLYADIPMQGSSPLRWTPEKLAKKLEIIATVLKKSTADGQGPDLVVLNELEVDHTPESTTGSADFITAQSGKNYRDLLKGQLSPSLEGAPIEAWLMKALEDEGLRGYTLVLGDTRDIQTEAIRCGVLSRLPIRSVRQHLIEESRAIIEVEVDAKGTVVHLFANHWKSGAGDAATELLRISSAQVLRTRIDEILKTNPGAAIIVAGDLNSHYNQSQRFPYMPKTAVQDTLRSQGNVAKLQSGEADLYNLWYDVAPEQRGSDTYNGEWGTLMQFVISRGLADGKGLDYIGGSFRTVIIPGINSKETTGLPWSWTSYGPGAGCSDHFPVIASFRITADGTSPPCPLTRTELSPPEALPVYPKAMDRTKLRSAATVAHLGPDAIANALGEVFAIEGTFQGGSKPKVQIGEVDYSIYIRDRNLLAAVKTSEKGTKVSWIGQLQFYKGKLEFAIVRPEWIKDPAR